MLGRIVEIAEDNRYLSLSRGFMVVQSTEANRAIIGQVPIDDIAAVIANAHGLSYSNNLLVALAERAAPLVLCAANHNPVGMLISIDGNFQQAKRFDAQIAASLPLKKRLWADIVKAKLQQQAAALSATGAPSAPLSALINKVRSGDPENIEAQGARRYWSLLFGNGFRRDQQADGINALLNYGYTVLRASTARAVLAAGLHPTLGLHHSNQGNAMRLVDDLMEPFRPLIDIKVWQLHLQNKYSVNAETKRSLVQTLFADMSTAAGITPVSNCIQQLATSLALIYIGERDKLELPLSRLPLDIAASLQQAF
jgi:CRISPR-associated protein Cas1